MPSNPLPVNLPAECRKAQKIFQSFVDPVNGLDHIIPPSVLRRAKGFCFMSVAKAGFVFSARAGSGIVIARLEDGTWSAPSAVGTAGGGVGFQVGVEVAEFLIILNSRAAVKSFMSAGSITVGGNMSIAAGPLGRNVEGTGALSSKGKVAAMYSYSRSKGLFGGASVEGSIIVERSDANAKAYGSNVTVTQLLSGQIEPPTWATGLISTVTRLASGLRSLPGGGWGLDSPLDSPYTPSSDIEKDEEGYFSRARIEREKARREKEERDDAGLTPREYAENGYAFGSSYAAGGSGSGSGIGTPEKEKSQIRAMLGSVGRSRSGSGASSTKKSSSLANNSYTPSATGDPFAEGPAHTGEARFETHFSSEFDFAAAQREGLALRPPDSLGMSRESSTLGVKSPLPSKETKESDLMDLGGDEYGKDDLRSGSPARHGNRSRSGSGTSWFGGGGNKSNKPKLTKSRSSTVSSGLRERAEAMQWGNEQPGERRFGRRDSRDSLDDEFERYKEREKEKTGGGRFRASTVAAPSARGPVTAFDLAALSNQTRNRSASSPLAAPSRSSPFDSTSSLSSTASHNDPVPRSSRNAYSAKPWDSEDEFFVASTSSPARSPNRSRSGTTASCSAANLNLRQVEADFAGVMDLSKHGGAGEVGSYSNGTRSRSSTIGAAGTPGQSRSGTGTSTPGGGGIGKVVALYDFPGVEAMDLPFKKGDVITILAKEDEEWWKGRLKLREGMLPRNYVEEL
ncbi:SH4 domain protein [Rhodotorula toruloides]|uniref:SH4 domain protein n=1 Tax=Rhodotorula toruloides TaxID=5286 RepID=A0A511KFC9_RHOTO|nr:SH4 domain protein [Rhodotorula toruloides]